MVPSLHTGYGCSHHAGIAPHNTDGIATSYAYQDEEMENEKNAQPMWAFDKDELQVEDELQAEDEHQVKEDEHQVEEDELQVEEDELQVEEDEHQVEED